MIKDIGELLKTIDNKISNFTDIATIGLSGGADSTLVAILCKEALGNENVYGISMPKSNNDLNIYNKESVEFAKHIKINSIVHPITKGVDGIFCDMLNNLNEATINGHLDIDIPDSWKLITGNACARERMQVLYTYNECFADWSGERCRVVGTGNLSEDFIGYATKYGDLGVDINPIGTLFKSEVYQLLDWFKDNGMIEEKHINRVPSANLWGGQTDEDEIGMSYDEMEPIISNIMEPPGSERIESEMMDKVCKLHWDNQHKMEPVPVIDLRKFCDN